jgi:ketosteroid isomerase-like protein
VAGDNPEAIRRLYTEVWGRGRLEDPATEALLPEFFDPEVELLQTSSLAGISGRYHGYSGLVESNRENLQATTDIGFELEEIRASGDLVAAVAIARGVGRRSGAPFEARVGHLFTLSEGRVVRLEVFDDPAGAFEALE